MLRARAAAPTFTAMGVMTPIRRTAWALRWRRLAFKARRDAFGPLRIFCFRGHGTRHALHVAGRVLERGGAVEPSTPSGTWANFQRTVARFNAEQIPCARLLARWNGRQTELRTDREGYFRVVLPLESPLPAGWHEVELELLDSVAGGEGLKARAEVMVPPDDADYGVISDIDDTVVHTVATNRLKMIRIVLFQDAHGRIPLPGVGAFLRALRQGPSGKGYNPVFYVSRSPWNLYDLFATFFDRHDLPRGPLFLRDLGWLNAPSQTMGLDQDKLSRIRRLLVLYPELPFVLMGDSGQKDPEIYAQIVREHPGRIKAVYIRDVTRSTRADEVRRLAEEIREHDVPMVLEQHTLDAAGHAVTLGLIHPSSLPAIRGREAKDEAQNERLGPLA